MARGRVSSIGLAAAFLLLSACMPARVSEGREFLKLPYDVKAPASVDVSFDCPAPPAAPMRDLLFESVYKQSDPHRATIDKEAKEAYMQETGDSQRFGNDLLRLTNSYLKTGARQKAQCALQWLDTWAGADALLGDTSDRGIAVRQWMLASFASAYGQIRSEKSLDRKQRTRVEKWLRTCAATVMADYPEDATQGRKFNNHLYWAAWAVAMTGIATGDRSMYDWSMSRARWVLEQQVEDDGTLPLEMGRGRKALQYHIFAAAPLVMLAEAAARNGGDLYAIRDGILHRFVERVVSGMKDPSYFEEKAGARQLSAASLYPGHFGWLEAYDRRFPSEVVEKRLARLRPAFFRQTGGDMTFLFQ